MIDRAPERPRELICKLVIGQRVRLSLVIKLGQDFHRHRGDAVHIYTKVWHLEAILFFFYWALRQCLMDAQIDVMDGLLNRSKTLPELYPSAPASVKYEED